MRFKIKFSIRIGPALVSAEVTPFVWTLDASAGGDIPGGLWWVAAEAGPLFLALSWNDLSKVQNSTRAMLSQLAETGQLIDVTA